MLIQVDFNEMYICQEFGHALEATLKARNLGELNFKAAKASSNAVWIIIDRHFLGVPQGRELWVELPGFACFQLVEVSDVFSGDLFWKGPARCQVKGALVVITFHA